MSAERRDNHLKHPPRRGPDARVRRPTRRAFRPLAWAWLLMLVALLTPAYDLFLPAGWNPAKARRTVVIERGQSLHEIAQELQRVGVIRSQFGFLVLARAMHLDRSVKAGQYSFRVGISVPALLRALDRGMYGLNLVTIPEGLMVSETARLLERQIGIPASTLDSLARDPYLLDSLGVSAPSLEGWLAPDSYEWLPGTNPDVVLRTMVARTRERVQRATAGYDSLPLGMNAHEVLTLASIVESESRAKEERPRIARVYLNRLERGMLLQADPTVGYALGRGPRSRLTFKDLRVISPYNTYRHEGLPPGPICSPGLAAIEAVMNATVGVNDLYFVARGEGRHIFAPTYEQHLANIAMVRGKQRALAARTNPDAGSTDAEPDSGDVLVPVLPTTPLAAGAKPVLKNPPLKAPLAAAPRPSIKTAAATPVTGTIVTSGTHALRAPLDSSTHLSPRPRTGTRADSVRTPRAGAVQSGAGSTAPMKLVTGDPATNAAGAPRTLASKPAGAPGATSAGARPGATSSTSGTASKPATKRATGAATSKSAASDSTHKPVVRKAAKPAATDSTQKAAAPKRAKPAAHDTTHAATRKVASGSTSGGATGTTATAPKPAPKDTTGH